MLFKRISLLNNKYKILYLPIEIYTREFHSKIYLAHEAAQRGWTVLIGPKYDINSMMKYLPKGIYSGIGFHKSAALLAKKFKSFGHKVFSQDEEGLVRLSPEFYKEYRVDAGIEKNSDLIFCWGKEHREIMKSIFINSKKIISVGNTRIDILKSKSKKIFENDVKMIKEKYGDFILINGNFGSANHFSGQKHFIKELESRGWLDSEEKKEYQLKRIAFQNSIFLKMMQLSVEIAKTGKKVIVRPHPSENIERWKEYISDYKDNIEIIRSGNVIPWIIACNSLIHNGCTTAVEAFLMGKNVISFRPLKNKAVESVLPNAISNCLENEEDVLNYLKNNVTGGTSNQNALNILKDNIEEDFEFEDSSTRLINQINQLKLEKYKSSILNNVLFELNILKMKISKRINKQSFKYEQNKCPSLKEKDVQDILSQLSSLNSNENNFDVFNFTEDSIILRPRT